ncbi:NAD(P)-dependent oxidoreductase [Paenibacillus sp. ACRRX]|uniref:NAD-dependent epimerase/dehydratase family protein n=1 Tax=Paenibacillus sp. ACRRX TaxID=2918206 RepID=UPI001EF5EAAF|nr:NAD(P)-dependent oxidoreductase [Paenibacillus sp. ACRRX]MCG7408289.1 NAD(P)-dependent oxidoreductase [Paenibacillus sp. ACRRX]
MKIFVAGSTGVIGRLLIHRLVHAGHEVVGMTHRLDRKAHIQAMGAKSIVVDVFERDAVLAAVGDVRPDVIIHQLTSLSNWSIEDNARIRIEGTRNLVDAAQAAGVTQMIAQSISWAYEPGDHPAGEQVPLDIHAPLPRKTTIDGISALERIVAEIPEHVILRYGALYGPHTWYDHKGLIAEKVIQGQLPATDGITSFLHVEDAANAALLALDWPPGPVHVVDDEPAAGTEWLPVYATALQAPVPAHQSGRQRGERGASNAMARNEYGWTPLYPTWRTGFAQSLNPAPGQH